MKTYTVGQLAKLAGVTVRTLHHYEAEGLLLPQGRSGAGYRRYGVAELERLSCIQLLRQMGLSLVAIAELLSQQPPALSQLLQAHVQQLEQKLQRQQEQLQQLKQLLQFIQHQGAGEPELERLLEQLKMLEEYYSPEQLNELRQRGAAIGPEALAQSQRDWQQLFDAFAEARRTGLALDSTAVGALVAQARELVGAFTQGQANHQASLQRMYQQESPVGMMRGFGMQIDDETWDYYCRAMQGHVLG